MSKTVISPLKLARYRHLVEPGSPVRPIHWDVDPSSVCDHTCRGCPYIYDGAEKGLADPMLGVVRPGMVKQERGFLDFDAFAGPGGFLYQAFHLGCHAITFVGGGEPTLHPQFTEMMEHAHDFGVKFGVVTHLGRKYKPELLDAMAKATWVRVSVNAGTRETYERHQGKDHFVQAMKNMSTLARRAAELGTGCRVGMSFLITNDNWKEIVPAANLAQLAGAAFIQFKPIIEVGEPGKVYEKIGPEIALELVQAWKLEGPGFQVIDQWAPRLLELKKHHEGKFSGPCHVPRFNPKLGANGIIYSCCELAYNDDAALGSIYDEPLETILERAGQTSIDQHNCPHCWAKGVNQMINEGRLNELVAPSSSDDEEFV